MAAKHKTRDELIEEYVREVLFERLGKETLRTLTVAHDTDFDGDAILRVRVIFDGKRDHLEADQTRGLVRSIREKLTSLHEDAFPILSFISVKDAKEFGAAA